MDVDDVVDLSMGRDSVSLSNATVRDLRALTQNAGLTITPAPPSVNNGMYREFNLLVHFYFVLIFFRFVLHIVVVVVIVRSIKFGNHFNAFILLLILLYKEPYSRRVLRPRTEPKSYAEAPDIVLLPAKINGRQQNGNIDSDTDDEEMPPIIAIKVLCHNF